MALPDNDHYVHSDGYYPDGGGADPMRLMEEVADEIEQIDGVEAVYPDEGMDGPYIDVEYDGTDLTYGTIMTVVGDWDVEIVDDGDDWMEVRP